MYIPSDQLMEHAVSLWESMRIAPEEIRGFGLTLRNLSPNTPTTPIHNYFGSRNRSSNSPHRKKKLAVKKEESLISRLLNEHRSRPLPETPMIDLPPLASLDLDVFQMLPRGLQEEMLRSYRERENEIPAKFRELFREFAEEEEEKKVFAGFVENLMVPIMDKEKYFAVKKYVDEYEINQESIDGICVSVQIVVRSRNWCERE